MVQANVVPILGGNAMVTFDYPIIDMKATGERMRQLRKQNNLNVRTVCKELGVSPQAMGKWENGKSLPTLENLYALSHIYQTQINDILIELRR